jgi:hypothetical protein
MPSPSDLVTQSRARCLDPSGEFCSAGTLFLDVNPHLLEPLEAPFEDAQSFALRT